MARVLVVDDELGITEALEDVLGDEGYSVVVVHNGRDAMEHIRREPPDVLLLDYMMPVMDGGEVIRALSADPKLRALPVVMMSAMPRGSIPADVTPRAYLHKPFDIDDMLAMISQLIGRDDGKPPGASSH